MFCKRDSSGSKSIEHIIPESLGNHTHVLPPGVVCDKCNNYFAREVEKPFLDCDAIALLRFEQALPSKRGNIPPATGIAGGERAVIRRSRRPDLLADIDITPAAFERIMREGKGIVIVPASHDKLPTGPVVSRFLAKVALESMAARLVDSPGGLNYLVEDVQFDPIRNHARFATGGLWPVHIRRIYPADRRIGHNLAAGESGHQIVHESDILVTDWSEYFFVFALFGLEMSINIGGPELDGYHRWLGENADASPLSVGKNAAVETTGRLDASKSI